jgi:DNA-binding NarL/FixJ family response regulator
MGVGSRRAGANGYLLKDTPREQLFAAIRGTMEGKSFIDPESLPNCSIISAVHHPPPQKTKQPVCSAIANGSAATGGARSQQSRNCSKVIPVRRYGKKLRQRHLCQINVTDRTQATLFALRNGLAKL